MRKSKEIGELVLAVSAFQSEVKDVVKDQAAKDYNQKVLYKYANLTQILEMVRPLLSKNGLALSQFCQGVEQDSCMVESLLAHKSGQWILSSTTLPFEEKLTKDGRKTMTAAQSAGSTISYARRYAALCLLGISQEDDDGAGGQPQPSNRPAQQSGYKESTPLPKPAYQIQTESEAHKELKALIDTLKIGESLIFKWCEHYGVTNLSLILPEEAEELSKAIKHKYDLHVVANSKVEEQV